MNKSHETSQTPEVEIILNLPVDMQRILNQIAKKNGKSLQEQIALFLEKGLSNP